MPRHPPAPRSRRQGAVARLACALLLVAACARAPHELPDETELGTVRRLIEHGVKVANDPRLERGAYVFLDSTAHPVLTSAKAYTPAIACAERDKEHPRAPVACRAAAPSNMPKARYAIVERETDDSPKRAHVPIRSVVPTSRLDDDEAAPPEAAADRATASAELVTPMEPVGRGARSVLLDTAGPPVPVGRLTPLQSYLARLYPAAPLAERTLTSESFTVPADAILRLSIGIEEAAWWIDSAPVYFRVVVEDKHGGQAQDLFRRVLDPARREADRRWFDADVDLSDLAGKTVRLRFLTEPLDPTDQRPSLPLWGDPRLLAPAKRTRPSIVLVSLDTLRAKSMSTYGYELETSPNISALAARGALFERAFTTFSNTLPSHMSMLTGLYPATHGVLGLGNVLAYEQPTAAELLRNAGFVTGAFTEDALLDSRRGFRRGFSTYLENTDLTVGLGDAAGTFGRALEWAGRNADQPFFLFVHTYQVHMPYRPPPAYSELFGTPENTTNARAQRAYEREIRYVDDVLQRFVDGLRRIVPDEELLLIVTADHGEEFGEHGMTTHQQLYDEVMHIPLVMVWPGHAPEGLQVSVPVSLVDVTPTILDLAGVPVPRSLDGVSLKPLLASPPGDFDRTAVLAEFPENYAVPERRFVARSATEKCILSASDNADVCFDLVSDPDERNPRGREDTVGFASLVALAEAYRAQSLALEVQPGDIPQQGKVADAAPAPSPDQPSDGQDPVTRKLRALGYVE